MNSQNSIKPNKSTNQAYETERLSCHTLTGIFINNRNVDVRLKEAGNTMANIDGEIILLDNQGYRIGQVEVQVKTYNKSAQNCIRKHPIPREVIGHADYNPLATVILIAVNNEDNEFYWKIIDTDYIAECNRKGKQESYTYHFQDHEVADKRSVGKTINSWIEAIKTKEALLKRDISEVDDIVQAHLINFSGIKNYFHTLEDSFIPRTEVNKAYEWTTSKINSKNKPILLITGNAGAGKSVIIKEYINLLLKDTLPVFAIKADTINTSEEERFKSILTTETILRVIKHLTSKHGKCIFVIDQIDALSQNLSYDRRHLSKIISVIKRLCEDCPDKVRIVISCRKFDLDYDYLLEPLKGGDKIEVGPLEHEDIKYVLGKLDYELPSKLSDKSIKFLENPQNLDTYCRIYNQTKCVKEFTDYRELFETFWWNAIELAPIEIERKNIEDCIFRLARKMQEQETLFPNFLPNAEDRTAINYLASQGIVNINGNKVSFFHQRFYDHALARYYLDSKREKLFVQNVVEENLHQGLKMRPTVKLILDYESEYNRIKYLEDIKFIIKDSRVRYHIKEIALAHFGNQEDIYDNDLLIIDNLFTQCKELFNLFIRKAGNHKCIEHCQKLLSEELPNVLLGTREYLTHATILNKMAAFNPTLALTHLASLKDENTKTKLGNYMLYNITDFNNPLVIKWLDTLKANNQSIRSYILERVADSNPQYVLNEFSGLLLSFLNEESNNSFHDIESLYEKLSSVAPKDLYITIRDSFFKHIEPTKEYCDFRLKRCNTFGHKKSHYIEQVLMWLPQLILKWQEDTSFIKEEIQALIKANEDSMIAIAFMIAAELPSKSKEITIETLNNRNLMFKILGSSSECQYHFHKALVSTWPHFTQAEKEWYQNYVMNYSDEIDFYNSKERRGINDYHYRLLWRRRWELIHSIPEDEMSDALRRHKLELIRRYGKFENSKPRGASVAHVCNSLVDTKIAIRFNIKQWRKFIQQVDDNRSIYWGKRHFDIRRDIENFKYSIEQRPDYFLPLIDEMFVSEIYDSKTGYKLAAIQGLLASRKHLEHAWMLLKNLLDSGCIKTNYHQVADLMKVLWTEGICRDEITQICHEVVMTEYNNINPRINDDKTHIDRLNRCLNSAINSPQGQMIEVLADALTIEASSSSHKSAIENIIKDSEIHQDLKTLIFNRISKIQFASSEYREKLFDIMLEEYSGIDYIILNPQIIYDKWRVNNRASHNYINAIINDKEVHTIIAQIMFLSSAEDNVGEESRRILEMLLNEDNTDVINGIIKFAFEYFHYNDYKEISEQVLRKFKNDTRTDVTDAYCHYCNNLDVGDIDLFIELCSAKGGKHRRDIIGLIKYLRKCIHTDPGKCISFISDLLREILSQEEYIYADEIIDVMYDTYECLNERKDTISKEKVMDVFDMLFLSENPHLERKIASLG